MSIESLFDHLDHFPTVSREQAVALLEWTNQLLNTNSGERLYEVIAG